MIKHRADKCKRIFCQRLSAVSDQQLGFGDPSYRKTEWFWYAFPFCLTLAKSRDIIYRKFFGNLNFDNNTGTGYEKQHGFPFRLTLAESYDIIYHKFFDNLNFDNNIGIGYEKQHGFPQYTNISA